MRLPSFVIRFLASRLLALAAKREPDEIIGNSMRSRLRDGPHKAVAGSFMRRWFVIPKNRSFNIYVHNFTRDDDDRALHDHPWTNLSVLLDGSYIEHTIAIGGVHKRELLSAGAVKIRSPWSAHRVECLKDKSGDPIPCWTLFVTGPTQRKWGFHCPTGWKSSKDFGQDNGCST